MKFPTKAEFPTQAEMYRAQKAVNAMWVALIDVNHLPHDDISSLDRSLTSDFDAARCDMERVRGLLHVLDELQNLLDENAWLTRKLAAQ